MDRSGYIGGPLGQLETPTARGLLARNSQFILYFYSILFVSRLSTAVDYLNVLRMLRAVKQQCAVCLVSGVIPGVIFSSHIHIIFWAM